MVRAVEATATRSVEATVAGGPDRPSPLVGAAHFAAVWALAFAHPLFDLLGRNSTFFVARGNGAGEIVAFALIVTAVPFLVLWALESGLERLVPRARWPVHLGLLGAVSACLYLQLLGQLTERPAGMLLAASVALAVVTTWLYTSGRFVRSVADVLTPAPAVVLVIFLLVGPTSTLVFPAGEPEPLDVEPEAPSPVVLLVYDELPTGSLMEAGGGIDATRYPAFAELASQSTWYRNATTVAAFTSKAVPAILTGRLPAGDLLPIASEQPQSLFTLLGGEYRLGVLEDATSLCPEQLCPEDEAQRTVDSGLGPLFLDLSIVSQHLLLPEALRAGLPDVTETFGGFAEIGGGEPTGDAAGGEGHVVAMAIARGGRRPEAVRYARFMDEFVAEGDDRPAFLMLHSMKPHYPWRNLPDGRVYSPDMGEWIRFMDDESRWQAPEAVTDIALQRHLLEVGHADSLLGQVIEQLRDAGIWDDALVMVTADHGGAMIPGEPRRNPSPDNLGEVAPVPFFVKSPGQSDGMVVDDHACTTDLVGILAEEIGAELPWEVDECPEDTVSVADLPEGQVEAPFDQVMAQRQEYVERIERLFGTGSGWSPVLAPRFGRALLGRTVAGTAGDGGPTAAVPGTAPVAAPSGDRSALPEDPEKALAHDPDAAVIPALLQRGELEGIEPGEPIAIAANGRIAAVGRAYELEGKVAYSMLLPPLSLRPGENEIEVFAVSGLGPGGELAPGVSLEPLWPG